jgi:hypothetical protein
VASFVVLSQIRLGFDNYSGAFPPNQLSSDQFAGASDRVPPEKSRSNNSTSHVWSWVDGESLEGESA